MKKMALLFGLSTAVLAAGCGSKTLSKAEMVNDLARISTRQEEAQEEYEEFQKAQDQVAEMIKAAKEETKEQEKVRGGVETEEQVGSDEFEDESDSAYEEEFKDSTYDGTQDSLMIDAFGTIRFVNPGHDSVAYYVKTADGKSVYESPELGRDYIDYWRAYEDFEWGETVDLSITMEMKDNEVYDSETRSVKLVIDEW